MSEPAPPAVPEHPPEGHAGSLTPETIDRVLADFRRWLVEAALGLTPPARQDEPGAPAVEPPDLHTLLGQMIAVRQEVNLQTKAVRAQQEQTAESLELLEEALGDLQRSKSAPQPPQSPDDLLRPLLKTLVDLHDALSLAAREAQRVQEAVLPALGELLKESDLSKPELSGVEAPPLEQASRPLLARMLGVRGVDPRALADWKERTRAAYADAAFKCFTAYLDALSASQGQSRQGAERVRQLLASLLSGYRMGLQRVERAMQQHGLEPIPAVGEAFDPERMEVLEAVENTGRPSGEVLDEVRRGYLWRSRVFRYAQVRVARS